MPSGPLRRSIWCVALALLLAGCAGFPAVVAPPKPAAEKVAPVALGAMMRKHVEHQNGNGEPKPAPSSALSEADVQRIAAALAALTKR